MAVLKCTVCGGELEINQDVSIGVCKFCDSTITIPKNLDKKGNLYNRAVFLRQSNEFDKAVNIYEEILNEDNEDAEAHWGLVLSKFGIEYVDDPATGEKKPTCHRTQVESILTDLDYLAAIQYSDANSKTIIEAEAKRIYEIQQKILEISKNEPPYDIFICYKETDNNGERTQDSAIAQEIYYELTKKGYKVFFARKTLEGKLGVEYEPVIFSALNSAKVMIVVGTNPEYFNAVWVRNEWSRFLKMAKSSKKLLIPAYKVMTAYELPQELASLQSQDMGKIAFMQDLVDGIERFLRGAKGASGNQSSAGTGHISSGVDRLVEKSQTYLKLDNYELAEETYRTAIKDFPEDYRGWWGLVICRTKNLTDINVDQADVRKWYGYAKKLAEPEQFKEVEEAYVGYLKKLSYKSSDYDIGDVRKRIKSLTGEIENCKGKIGNLKNNEIPSKYTERDSKINSFNNDIGKTQIILNEYDKELKILKMLRILALAVLAVALIFAAIGDAAVFFGIVLSVIALYLLYASTKNGSKKSIIKKISDSKTAIDNFYKTIEQCKIDCDEQVKKCEEKIEIQNANIKNLTSKIADSQYYIDLSKDEISSYWFEKLCEEIGVSNPAEDSLKKARKKAFGLAESDTAEKTKTSAATKNEEQNENTVVCAACGGETVLSPEEVKSGVCICRSCGAEIKKAPEEKSIVKLFLTRNLNDADAAISCTKKIGLEYEVVYVEENLELVKKYDLKRLPALVKITGEQINVYVGLDEIEKLVVSHQ